MRKLIESISLISAVMIAGCGGPISSAYLADISAIARISGLSPHTARGEVYFIAIPHEGLWIQGHVQGLIPDHSYAVFVYENGNCANEKSPGLIFDPGNSGRHGTPGLSPGEHHAGDLPNITADENGIAVIDYTTNALGAGRSSFSVIGKSLVIHAGPSDYISQPAGGSGEIIACGIIRLSEQK